MNSDQIAEIRPAVCEALDGAPKTCVTFEIEGDSEKWVQVTSRSLNVVYPRSEKPELTEFQWHAVRGLSLEGWEPGKYATFAFAESDPRTIAEWIDRYFVEVLGCPDGEYHVDVSIQEI